MVGIVVMMALYFLDYTLLARFSRVIAVILLAMCLLTLLFGSTVNGFNDGVFNNNAVANPESLIHGGCFESEKQFLKKRIALLASYCSDFNEGQINQMTNKINRVDEIFELFLAQRVDELSQEDREFIDYSRRATTDKSKREFRTNYIVGLLLQ